MLFDVRQGNRTIPAVAVISKVGLLFLLDRVTGKPIYGVEERPVPASDVPGEAAWPTQPFPLKPVPLARTSMTRAEVSKRTPEVEKYCTELFDSLAGRSLIDAGLRQRFGVVVVGIRRADGRMDFNPEPETAMNAGDDLVVMGRSGRLKDLEMAASAA